MRIRILLVMLLCTAAWAKATDTEKSSKAPPTRLNTASEQASATEDLQHRIEQRRQQMREGIKELTDPQTNKDSTAQSAKAIVEAKGCPKSVPRGDSFIRISDASLSSSGWNLMLNSVDDELTELETRPVGHSIWTPAQAYDQTFSAAFAELSDCANIEVRATTADGRQLGPHTLMFDAVKSVRKQAMESLRMTPGGWVEVRPYPDADHIIVYFTHLVTYRCGLREIRYSIDNEKLDQRWPLPACSLDDPFSVPRDAAQSDLSLPEKHEFVAVQLVYADESVSDVVIQRHKEH